jgi:hypothetical protein
VLEEEPVGVDAERDLFRADFDYGVMRVIEAVGRCVGAEQGGPGGPEFGVEFSFDFRPRFLRSFV